MIDLDDNDYVRMKEVLDKNPNKTLEVLSGEDFELFEKNMCKKIYLKKTLKKKKLDRHG
ncbi:MAG: hypothetical protein P8X62_11060 [Flavobacteriaceae bacterium]